MGTLSPHKPACLSEDDSWYCVSENFKDTFVLRSVIVLATKDRCDLPDNIELLRGRLHQVIGGKRFLLILDDVWNEDRHKWEDNLKPILCSLVSGSGSMIVVTSRSPQVASIMGTLPSRELAFLSKVDSWELFSKKAFHNRLQDVEEFSEIGRRIVDKCQGLPLALDTMGGLMNSKKQVQEWEAIAESDISATSGGKNQVLPILKLSYRHLSPELKSCFAFCAVFPKDYEMEKDKLIKLWIANGFIHEEGELNLAQKGELVFDELVWRAFLQDFEVESFYNYGTYLEVRCKMHDLMHDLANYVTDECQFAEELSQKKASVLHLQLLGTQISGSIKGTSFLRTLLTQSGHNKHLSELKLRSLRALCCIDPSIHTQFTTHLRYLDLSGSWIDRLPNSICTLYNLQTLRLNGCTKLQQLPEGMTSMKKLSHVYLFGCYRLQYMPPKLSLMHNLQTLTTFVVGTGDGFGIEELKDLGQLGNRLELYNLKKVKSGSKANLHSKHNLNELLLHWGRCEDAVYNEEEVDTTNEEEVDTTNEEEVLESLVPHGELKGLEVCEYSGLAIPQWMKKPNMFKAITKLSMNTCPRCTDLPIVWLSSSLEYLSLCRMDNLTTLCKNVNVAAAGYNNSPQIFLKLKRVELEHLPKLETWEENSEKEPNSLPVLPQLEKLIIIECNKLSTLPESPLLTYLLCNSLSEASQVPKSMPLSSWSSISYLRIGFPANVVPPQKDKGCESHSVPDTLRALHLQGDDGFQSTFNSSNLQLGLRDCLAFVEDLNISSCSNIVSWPMEELRYFPRLRSLRFFQCYKLDEKGSSSEEILPLPRLETLGLLWMSNPGGENGPFPGGNLARAFPLPCKPVALLDVHGPKKSRGSAAPFPSNPRGEKKTPPDSFFLFPSLSRSLARPPPPQLLTHRRPPAARPPPATSSSPAASHQPSRTGIASNPLPSRHLVLSSTPHGHGQAHLHPHQTQGKIMGSRKQIMEYRKEKIRKFMQMEEEADDEFIFVIVPAILEMLNDEKSPVHTSEYTGAKKMREILEGHEKWREGLLRDTRGVAVEEQLGMSCVMFVNERSIATGDLNFTSTEAPELMPHTSAEPINLDDPEVGINPFSANLEGRGPSNDTINLEEDEHTTSSCSGQKVAGNGKKRKQSQVAAVLQNFVDFIVKQTKDFMDEFNVNTKPSEDYSIKNCLAVLESIDELSEMEKAKAAKIFKCEQNREIFLNLKNPEVRLKYEV
ncbi:hypothetical protein EJB05_47866, partial [Eragrostis curvula]